MQKSYKSFEAYLENEYYDLIYNAIKHHILGNGGASRFNSYTVLDPSYIEIDAIHVKGVSFHGDSRRLITFNAAVEADVILKGMGRCDYEADMQSPWFSVSFMGQLIAGLRDVTLLNVSDYSKDKFSKENSLSKFLVPYLYSENLDAEAEKFLETYYPEALETPMPIDVDELVDNMCLVKYYAPLPENVFGKSYFAAADVEVFDDDMEDTHIESIDLGTILINPDVYFMRNVGSENNTVVHECVHHDRHNKFFELQLLLNADVTSISCEVVEEYNDKMQGRDKAMMWMEWQANALTPRILMPARTTKIKLDEFLHKNRKAFPFARNAEIMQFAIQELADFFHVSKFAAKLRAVDLGYDQAAGTFNYVDGRYYPPFSFKQGTLKKNETFVLDEQNAMYESTIDQEVAALVHAEKFIYAGNMFCINDPKYVTTSETGIPILTDYALDHVDECCLVFSVNNQVCKSYDDSYYRQCFLCRDADSSNFVEATFNARREGNEDTLKRAEEMKKIDEEANKIEDAGFEMPGSFGGTLDYHIKRRKYTNEQMGEKAGMDERSIRDYRNNKSLKPELPTVLALCIALNLQPSYSIDLITKAGHSVFTPLTHDNAIYQYLIFNHFTENLEMWNQKLRESGVKQQLPKNVRNKKVS